MLDSTGFKRKTYADLLTEGEAKARELFGEDISTASKTPLGIVLRIFVWFLSILWQIAERIYLSGFVDTAEGVSLDRLSVYAGIRRRVDTKARGEVTFIGTAGFTVNPGLLIATPSDIQYVVTNSVTLSGGGIGTTTIEAVDTGSSGNAAVGEITVFVNPDANLASVTNAAAIANGGDRESDAAFRARFRISRAARGSANINSLLAAVNALSGVRSAAVVENDTLVIDSEGRPSKSFEIYVLGGASSGIAKAIFDNKPAGITAWGTETVSVKDIAGFPHVIGFSRPATIPIYAGLTVTTNNEAPVDVANKIRNAVVAYIGGKAVDGTEFNGSSMGEDVLWAKIIRAVYNVPGVENVSGGISFTNGSFTASDLAIDPQEVAQIDADNIGVTII
ncbi:baseplate J/gp47 family protein [Paenibacillus periandrae]|uniref:baseplate J/gp47 family protein n=1 Tax=Paenibacillus periandrae TaxID=1761741 RepID=UPI001F0971B2